MNSNQCITCNHYLGLLTCEAYPKRIPQQIVSGEHDHADAFQGDNGIRFELIESEDEDEE